ncbi:MAG: hypothetical protein ABI634_12705 [Acidobacteriota bacterium]
MNRLSILIRMIAGTILGAIVGAICVVVAGSSRPGIATDLDRETPAYLAGFYAGERDRDMTFAWTAERASVRLPGVDRTRTWSCIIRLRGARAEASQLPTVAVAVDGINVTSVPTTNEFADVVVSAPVRTDRNGLVISLTSLPSFKPGGGDPRELGVQVDRLDCHPQPAWGWPPRQATASVAASGAAVAGAIALIGGSMLAILATTVVVTAGLAVLVTSAGAAFGSFPATLVMTVIITSGLVLAIGRAIGAISKRDLSGAAIASLAAADGVFILTLLALLHPAKATVDALFQAHRFEWVMAGRYFFTQPMPDGVEFPYAIGLYVFAGPWAFITTNHVALLRGVVIATDVVASVVLAFAIARAWREEASGAVAIVFAALVPLPFVVIGNGNLTNAFGQSVALLALAAVAAGLLSQRVLVTGAVFAAVLTLGLVSHVSTLTLLLPVLGLTAVGFLVIGRGALMREALVIAGATAIALLLAFGLYYRHFTDVYRAAYARVLSPAAAAPATPLPESSGQVAALTRPLSRTERASDALGQSVDAVGWPMLVLAAIGAVRAWRRGVRDRLSIVVVSWIGVWLLFVVAGTLTRVDTQYQRYASEFIGRVDLATYPALVVLAASGLTWLWTSRRHTAWSRTLALVLGTATAMIGVNSWFNWFR